jgi:CBS domain-containing protein
MNTNREVRTMNISSTLAVIEGHGLLAAATVMPHVAQTELQIRRLAKHRASRLAIGVVSRGTVPVDTRDRFSLDQLADPTQAALTLLSRQIEDAPDLAALTRIASTARSHGQRLQQHGLGSAALTGYLTAINDLLTRRSIEFALARGGPAPAPWSWLAMGSQARGEQGFSTDQDNGIVFSAVDATDADRLRQWFLPFGQAINRDLDALGMTLCKGGIMAGNAQCCLSLEEWQERFATWMRIPDPQALLNATIFFDIKAVYGNAELAEQLRAGVLRLTPDCSALLRLMAQNALSVDVPIGFFREFVTDLGKGASRSLDMKTAGVRLLVDTARIMALAAGCSATGTVDRLRAAGPAAGLGQQAIAALVQAFNQMQGFRLRGQGFERNDDCNRLMPASLNSLERKILRECFVQARMAQQQIKLGFVRD